MPDPAVHDNYYECPGREPDEIWCYCDRPCYSPGDTLRLHVSTTAASFAVEILLDAAAPRVMFVREKIGGECHDTTPDASVAG